MSGRLGSVARPFAAVALVAAATAAIGLRPPEASAAPASFVSVPTRLYMIPKEHSTVVPDLIAGLVIPIETMKFVDAPTGDIISGQSREIKISADDMPSCNVAEGATLLTDPPFDIGGCTAVQLDVGDGLLSFDPAPQSADDPRQSDPSFEIYRFAGKDVLLRDADTPDDLEGSALALIGSAADMDDVLKTLVYTPTVDDPSTQNIDEDYYYDGSNPETLTVDIIAGNGDPSGGVTSYIDIKVLDYNNFPEVTVPQDQWSVADANVNADLDLFTPDGGDAGTDPDQPTFTVADEDNDEVIDPAQDGDDPGTDPGDGDDPDDGEGDEFLVAMWTTCGKVSLISTNGWGIIDDIEEVIDYAFDATQEPGADPSQKQQFVDALKAVLPDAVEQYPFVVPSNPANAPVTGFVGVVNDIEALNYSLGQVTFSAVDSFDNPLSDATCKVRTLITDLGNNGLPLHYFGEPPTGIVVPMFGVDFDTNYLPAVEELTITVGAGGPVTPTITSVSDVTLAEGNGGPGSTPFTFAISLDSPAVGGESVDVATTHGPAIATDDTDFAPISSTPVTFAAGATSATFTVPVNGDLTVEPDEHFQLNLSNATGLTIGDASGLGTVQNDDGVDAPPQVTSFTAQSKAEGTGAGTTAFDFTIGLSASAPAGGVAVRFATAHGTTDSTDLTTTAGQMVLFAEGQNSRTVTVQTNRDATVEPTEIFTATLTNPDGVTIAASAQSATATIVNDDLHTVSISDGTVVEGNAGTVDLNFTVSLSGQAIGNESVLVTTGGGNATVMTDYTPLSAFPVVFAAGETSKQVSVQVKGDLLDEVNETFIAVLNNPANLAVTDMFGTGTIEDDDTLTVSVADVTLPEGNAGTTNFVFTLALNGPAPAGTSVNVATTNGSATAGALEDYTSVNQAVAFMTGSQSATVTVPVRGETDIEPDETFTLTLSTPVGVAIADGEAVGTIQNDDGAAVPPIVSIGDIAVLEGNAGTTLFTFPVTLTGGTAGSAASVTAIVTHGTTDDTDLALPAPIAVPIPEGASSATVTVGVNGDDTFELDETFTMTLTAPQNLLSGDMAGVATVQNDDAPRHITSISPATLAEGNAGTTNFLFTLTLDGPAGGLESVVATRTNGTTVDADFADANVPVVFQFGQSTATATVHVQGDVAPEPDETFTLALSAPQNVVIDAPGTALGTVQNDDGAMAPPQIVALSDVTMNEGDAGTTAFVFTLTLDKPAVGTESVDVSTAHGPVLPTDAVDLTSLSAQAVTFAPAAMSATATVLVNGDADVEPDETFTLTLGNPQNVTIAAAAQSATGTVLNDDVIVQPPSPLTITVPADITVPNDPGEAGAAVTYPAPTTTGGVPPVVVNCSSPSGGFYPIGVTTVTCTATDSDQGQQEQTALAVVSDSFTITVVETVDPGTTTPTTPSTTTPPGSTVAPPGTTAPGTSVTAPNVGQLPATGGDTRAPLVIAGLACLAGIGLLLLRRRTRPAA